MKFPKICTPVAVAGFIVAMSRVFLNPVPSASVRTLPAPAPGTGTYCANPARPYLQYAAILLCVMLAAGCISPIPGPGNTSPSSTTSVASPAPLPPTVRCPQKTPAGNLANASEIVINPVPDHALGDIIDFTGTTNLAAGEPLVPEIYSAEFVPCPKGPSLPDSVNPCGAGFAGNVSVALGNCGINTWSWPVDTSQHGFQPGGRYLLSVSGRNGEIQNYTLFNITGSREVYGKPSPQEKIPGATT